VEDHTLQPILTKPSDFITNPRKINWDKLFW
jgi:hypothetical protein